MSKQINKIERIKQALGLSNKCRYCGADYEPHGFDDKLGCPNRCEWKEWEKREALKIDTTDDYLADGLGYGTKALFLAFAAAGAIAILLLSILRTI